MAITTDGIEKWDLQILDTVFEIATERAARKADFGAALGDSGDQLRDWQGKSGDAFRLDLGRHRADIDDDQADATAIATAFYNARNEVAACKTEWSSIKSMAASNNWSISPTGQLSGQVSSERRSTFDTLQRRLTTLMAEADRTDRDLATAIRAVVGDTKVNAQGHQLPSARATPNTVPGPHAGDPGYQSGQSPTLAGSPADSPSMQVPPGSSDKVTLADNPPGYTGGPGPARDKAWQDYLSQRSGASSGTITPGMVLPNPDAVSDPGLKTVDAAAKQQGVSYAWGGGHLEGTTGASRGWPEKGDRSETFQDGNRIGFDCAGLARFAASEGHGGLDISKGNLGNTVGQYGALTTPGGGGKVVSDAELKPGDLIYFGSPGHSEHVAVYAGNGLVVQAHQSGEPVEVSPFDINWQHRSVHIGD
ncbi:C40 family peptidase [Mycolicibacter icosiumassiliensis]|uniref:C40 family peptidase n=1 Tax=Mycolicibacter icosiumassiliensis TaxID=1792835 RepID=UPI00082B6C71|nr:NlpC/P60 family protein [Mycolicibacter icosiumassiliensis]